MCVVLANAYAGTLFSFISVSKLEPIVNSLEELANAKHLQFLIQDRTEIAIRLLVIDSYGKILVAFIFLNLYKILTRKAAASGTEKVIGDSLRANPDNLIQNLKQVKDKLATGRYVFAFVKMTI